ncbi:MAG TPA: NUDIX hydrolase [Syntrophomonadaceae bacterium]|nr:NUDIX hydrolase [Syntrophomonadaceae bacterium]
MLIQRYFYCPKCGGTLSYAKYKDRSRLGCQACGYIFYENPVVGVAGILFNDKAQILLGLRKTGAFAGLWCIPCGYLEYDEDLYSGIRREFKEETNLDIQVTGLFTAQSNFHDPERHSVGIWFLVQALSGQIKAGDDLEDVSFFDLDKLPDLAFPTDQAVLGQLIRLGDTPPLRERNVPLCRQ